MREHVARANYQTRIWKMANVALYEIPKTWEGHGWKEDGEPFWCADEMILPQQLIDVLESDAVELEKSDDETGEQEYGIDSDTNSSSDEE